LRLWQGVVDLFDQTHFCVTAAFLAAGLAAAF
jgi:hypothetical protein